MGRRVFPQRRQGRPIPAGALPQVARDIDFRGNDPKQQDDKLSNDCRTTTGGIKKGPARGLFFTRSGALCREYGPAARQQSRVDGRHQPEYSACQ